MNIYLLVGKAGSGKNYVANILKQKLPNAVITSLSKYIKLFALELGLWDGDDNNKPRKFLQTTGDKLRAVDENILTKRMLDDIKVYEMLNIKNIIISDVRLLNEINNLKNSDYNIIVIKVSSKKSNRKLTIEEQNHLTEKELEDYKDYDYLIENNERINEQIEEILKGR